MPDRVIVLSDLHISPPGPLATFHAGAELAALVRAHVRVDTTLVLAGDILDLLQVEPRPPVLDMPRAPELIRRALEGVSVTHWGAELFAAMGELLRVGGEIVLLPGNHDPELFHPAASALFLEAMGLSSSHSGFVHHRVDAPWTTMVGHWPVYVSHGHRVDMWNDIDPEVVLRAVETGNSDITLPPGSRLVLELLNPLKRAVHRHNNAPRFKFLDLLKPERRTAALLLPYLDWDLARSRSGLFVTLQTQRFLRRFERALRRGKVLGLTAEIAPVGMEEWLADAVAEEFDDAARSAPEATLRRVDRWISGEAPVSAGSLAAHGGAIRGVARWFLQHTSQDRSFFDARALSKDDGWVIERELPEGSGPRVAIAGHTHAARFHDFGDGRVYVNTGTWMDLMALPRMNNEMAIKRWIDRLERGDARRICWRRTYAEVTVDGPALRVWGRGAQAERLLSRWRTRTART